MRFLATMQPPKDLTPIVSSHLWWLADRYAPEATRWLQDRDAGGFSEGRERGNKFRGELTIGKLISGAATNTSDWVAPTGFDEGPASAT